MKIALINDTHFGVRNDSTTFAEYINKFFDEIFFPYCKEHNITEVIHLGDLMDRRKFVNFSTLSQVRKNFMEPMRENGLNVNCIIGNHDTYFKNTNDLNSPKELFGDRYDNFHLHESPVEVDYDGTLIALVPWINKRNREDVLSFLKNTKASIVGGHFELNGYEVMRGVKFDGGMDDDPLKRFEMVLSGHFHGKHSQNNVHYLGTQYQITFSDLKEKKGFHVLDTETRAIEFVENPNKLFHFLYYDDSKTDYDEIINKMDFDDFKNTYVKIFVINKTKPYTFDKLCDKFYDTQVQNLTIVEDYGEEIEEEEVVDMTKDTITLIYNEVDTLENVNTGKIKELIRSVYMEALSQ
jgi:hypothetical protein